MTELVDWGNSAVRLRVVRDGVRAVVVGLDVAGREPDDIPPRVATPPAEVLVAGGRLPQGQRHVALGTTLELEYVSHDVTSSSTGSRLELVQRTPAGIVLHSTFTTFGELPVVRVQQTVRNESDRAVTLEHVSSLTLNGFARFRDADWRDRARLRIPHNTLLAEFNWTEHSLPSLGIVDVGFTEDGVHSSKSRISVSSIGTQSTTEYLPMGALEDLGRDRTWAWQIEANGSWQWEVGDHLAAVYLSAGGPNDQEHHWHRILEPGEAFDAVPLAIACTPGRLEDALRPLTEYRRLIRRPNRDDVELPVVFNDFMNSLLADPDEEKLPPVIAAAAAAGAEYFCIDAGWYADETGWWNTVGEWQESSRRFPHGFARMFDLIRDAGMIPGLWLEPDVVGVESPVANELPDSAFFRRHGARIDSQGRHQLDFRSPAVIERMDAVVDRLIADYGLGYLKFDYNINGGIGSDVDTDSAGDALLEHHRAFLRWIHGLFERHPDLVIENCSSGGARIDYASMAEFSILSTSDQTDHIRYAPIAAGAPSGVTPEQAAVWVYPQPDFGVEELRFAIVNGMLTRPQLSGGMWKLDDAQLATVAEAMAAYRTYRARIPGMTPIWPIGLPGWYDDVIAQGLADDDGALLAVWRRAGSGAIRLPLADRAGAEVEVLFPADVPTALAWDGDDLVVTLPEGLAARVIRIA
ncbi:glycoside hydrolase family 36 protein [Microbacterium sp. ASV49]|uniref:Alpha-galactosidase n=1 Tax=Microbacterium candidum TaxID=3041922 RepID=A0ABT7MWB3_9MICO|nr:glycoside hydrolase family 36 protein [Microbacterium sp. ASV49]MDL9978744.1 alpha-galactosidase [Microbacterium sp. ASV49]